MTRNLPTTLATAAALALTAGSSMSRVRKRAEGSPVLST